jgi:hypothetical protein
MATQRYISTSFWDDEWVQTLDPSEKLLYLYLMTNPLTNIAGVYKISNRRIGFDTGFNLETINNILEKFKNRGKVYRFNEYIAIPTWPKHQEWEKRQKIRDGIVSELQKLSDDVIEFLDGIGYQFDLSLIEKIIIARKQRKGISGTTVKKLREKYNNKCAKCGKEGNLHIHHIIPIKEGGDNTFDNLTLLCAECHKIEHQSKKVQIGYVDNNGQEIQSTKVHNYSDLDTDTDIESEVDSALPLKTSPSPFSKQREACGTHKNILLSKDEYTSLCNRFGKDNTRAYINKVSTYMQTKGKTYADHYATVQQWLEDDIAKGQIRLPSAEPVMPTKCDKCGKTLVDGKCVSCNRRVYGEGGSYQFEDIPDPTEIQRFAEKMRSFA